MHIFSGVSLRVFRKSLCFNHKEQSWALKSSFEKGIEPLRCPQTNRSNIKTDFTGLIYLQGPKCSLPGSCKLEFLVLSRLIATRMTGWVIKEHLILLTVFFLFLFSFFFAWIGSQETNFLSALFITVWISRYFLLVRGVVDVFEFILLLHVRVIWALLLTEIYFAFGTFGNQAVFLGWEQVWRNANWSYTQQQLCVRQRQKTLKHARISQMLFTIVVKRLGETTMAMEKSNDNNNQYDWSNEEK